MKKNNLIRKERWKMKLNNLYNFKNPIKHFFDIDSIMLPDDISSFELQKLCWSKPFNVRVKKQNDKYRTLKLPNILNFVAAYEHFKDLPNFNTIQQMDMLHKRLSANTDTGDFASGEYDRHLAEDFNRLCIYDYLLKMDIKEYYGRIYTHEIDFEGHQERFLSNMNQGATNGLIMGNYLSLFFAELNLKDISNDIEKEIIELGIDCEFSYFSDDFYFFCNKSDVEKIVGIFDNVLENYQLERNDDKKELWTYESFNNYNIVERYWKKVIAYCNLRISMDRENNKLYFINQIIYRISKLFDEKQKKVFINNFFKTKYFRKLDLELFQVKDYDYHQLCFIWKLSPESLLYSIDKFSTMSEFDKERVKKFFSIRYKEALKQPFHEEQLYYYYAIKNMNLLQVLTENKDAVLLTENQILISFYLKDGSFSECDIEKLKQYIGERYWFQNYHLILYTSDLRDNLEDCINKYLIPEYAKRDLQKQTYMDFYKKNLELNNSILRDISNVRTEIENYMELRIEEIEGRFEEDNDV